MDRYDVIVLGGGSAGTAAAAAARRAGAHTAMVNRDELGGLCILRGCMPTKAMLASSHAARLGDGIESLGAHLEGRVTVDFPKLMRRKQQLVERFKRAKIESIESNDYDVIFGHGRFLTDGTLDVDGRILAAERYVLATGSEPTVVPLPGIDEVPVWTSDDVMELTRQPESLVVFGAGAIGLELAQFFAEIGTRVLVVNRSPLLRRYDLEAGRELRAALGKLDELHFAIPGTIERLRREGDGLIAQVSTDDGSMEWTADALVMAAGRRPMIDGLGLDEVGVVVKDGRIRHDATMQTDNPRIYVAGDVTGELQILHLANDEGATAGHNAAGAEPSQAMDYRLAMSVIFSDPPFAQVGRMEADLERDGVAFVTGKARFPETGRAITMGVEHGFFKIFADNDSGEILGGSILGPRADDLIHLVSLLMHHRGTAASILTMPWYHPTLSEVILNVARQIEALRNKKGES